MLASAFASVAGPLESGRTSTSNVACDGSSAAKRTSIGPEREGSAWVWAEAESSGALCTSEVLVA
jgi:hypothetical protein